MIAKVLVKVNETKKKLAEFGFPEFDFSTYIEKLKPGCAGNANYHYKRIKISEDYLNHNTEQVLNVTVPHEVCHLYAAKYFPNRKQEHGPEFRKLMRLLGLEGNTYHSMGRPPNMEKKRRSKFDYKCQCGPFTVSSIIHNRIVQGKTYKCTTCSAVINQV